MRLELPPHTASGRLIAVVRGSDARDYDRVADVLVEHGVISLEFTLTTPGTLDCLERLAARYEGAADIGVGTVTTPQEVRDASGAGAAYIVTPVTAPEVVAAAGQCELPVIPGGFTPTELYRSWTMGAAAVKVFPANQLGAGYVKDLRGPFPDIAVVPSGGVGLTEVVPWLRAGAAAVSVGGPLIGDAMKGGDLGRLAQRAQAFAAAVSEEGTG